MVKVDLSAEAAAEVERLTKARRLIGAADQSVEDTPLTCVVRRRTVRRWLGARVLLLWRLAYEDANGRIAESALVALAVTVSGAGLDARHADWSDASLVSVVRAQRAGWRDAVDDAAGRSVATRRARERAIAAACATRARGFQAGLFDRRADRAHIAQMTADAELAEQLAVRMAAVAAGEAITLRVPELLLVLIPRDVVRM